MSRVLALAACVMCLPSSDAVAQMHTSWGASGTFTPNWKMPAAFAAIFDINVPETVSVHGTEFRIGVVRGRVDSGEWGVSFVRKRFADDSRIESENHPFCFGNSLCVDDKDTMTFQNVSISGAEIHKFIPFGTIKKRAQLGITLAGGAGRWNGEGRIESVTPEIINDPVFRFITGFRPEYKVRQEPIENFYVVGKNIVPLARLEVSAAAILTNRLKVRVSVGFSLPETHAVAITGTYFFGS